MTLAAIKTAIEGLTDEEKLDLVSWLLSLDRQNWDKQISDDFSSSGRGAKLLEEVDTAIDRGDFKPLR